MSEINFDGLVGPTHNYAGLAYGNVASMHNANMTSSPKQAALQGLSKMHLLMQLGIPQAVLPPAKRPNLHLLQELGFSGTPIGMLEQAYKISPQLLAAVYSASSMWAANAATISPSCNTADNKVHITPANLAFNLHRAQECAFYTKVLKAIFKDDNFFVHNQPIMSARDLCDEGAANHSVLCTDYNKPGLELFVYGRMGLDDNKTHNKYIGRQTKLASVANILNHKLNLDNTMTLAQSAAAINAGAFHNDVVFVANQNVLFYHANAFENWHEHKEHIRRFFNDDCYFIEISNAELSLQEAITTYLFNSQLISVGNKMLLIAPEECRHAENALHVIQQIISADNPITDVKFVECRESMQNGGGPACLRLRVMLTEPEQKSCLQSVFLTKDLYQQLCAWVNKHYRDTLTPKDLLAPQLIQEVEYALDELSKILQLPNIYD